MLRFGTQAIRVETPEAPWGASIAVEPRFNGLVERLQAASRVDPVRYRRQVLAAGALGLAVIAVILLSLLAIAGAIVAFMVASEHVNAVEVKLLLVVALLAYAIARSLRVTLPPPEGRELRRHEAPRLFAAIDDIRAGLDGPGVHHVLITDEFNAAIVQQPRFGIFGGYRNYLLLGLPLLQGMTADEVKSVIAHEYGHLAGSHGRSAAWVYRMRQIWAQLSINLAGGHTANLLRRFFAWYGPWFNAYSFVLARSNEYDADRAAADMTSPRIAAEALVRVHLQASRFDGHYWETIVDQASRAPAPSAMPFAGVGAYLADMPEQAHRILDDALAQTTGLEDTHPCLAERLAALGEAATIPPAFETSAADDLLGDLAGRLAAEFDARWWETAAEGWQSHHAACTAEREELAALDAAAAAGTLGADDALRRALLTEQYRGAEEARQLYEALAAAAPDDPVPMFAIGRLQLAAGEASGVALIDRAMTLDRDFIDYGCRLLFEHFVGAGEAETGARYLERHQQWWDEELRAEAEGRELKPDIELQPVELGTEARAAIVEGLRSIDGVRAAWIARRVLAVNGRTQHVLVIRNRRSTDAQAVCDAAANVLLPYGDVFSVSIANNTRWIFRRISKVRDSLLLQR